jgi:uncharacterized membrane protein YphA (DoxX/SURF4 family)
MLTTLAPLRANSGSAAGASLEARIDRAPLSQSAPCRPRADRHDAASHNGQQSEDQTMPVIKLVAVGLPIALGVVMIANGGVTFAGPSLVRENFACWGYPAGFHRVTGGLEVVAGLLLVIPVTSRAGAIGSAMIMLAAVATLIRHRDWGHLPVAAVLTAASVAAIAIHG